MVAAGKMELLNEKFICYFFNSLDPKKKNEVDSIEGIKEIELFEVDFPGRVDDIKDTKVKSKEKLGLASKIDVKDSISNLPKKKTAVRNKSPNPFESLYNRSKVWKSKEVNFYIKIFLVEKKGYFYKKCEKIKKNYHHK